MLLALVGIIISGILPVFLNVITVNKSSEYRGQAYKLADSKIEALRFGAFDEITTATTTAPGLPEGQIILNSTNLVDGAPQTNIKKVEVRVTWFFKKNEEVKLVTYVARNGIKK